MSTKPKAKSSSKPGALILNAFERVVTAYAEPCRGPGWSNRPVWIIIEDGGTGRLRTHCLQPTEQTAEMLLLYPFSAAAHSALMTEIRKAQIGGVM